MTKQNSNRRELIALLATGTLAAGAFVASGTSAAAYQGNMERALGSLSEAFEELRQATANKGGHRGRAMQLIQDAMGEVQAGITFADEHGGGGY